MRSSLLAVRTNGSLVRTQGVAAFLVDIPPISLRRSFPGLVDAAGEGALVAAKAAVLADSYLPPERPLCTAPHFIQRGFRFVQRVNTRSRKPVITAGATATYGRALFEA